MIRLEDTIMYLLKLESCYVKVGEAGYHGTTTCQSEAIRLDDSIKTLINGGYLRVHEAYRLVKLRPRATAAHPIQAPADRFDESDWDDDITF